jgi:galactokinase
MTIDRDVWLAAAPRADRKIRIYSMDIQSGAEFQLDDIQPDQDCPWTNYVRVVVWAAQLAGLPLAGFDGVLNSTVPIGSGVSSSAALEASVGLLLAELGQWSISGLELALLCQEAECGFVGMSCGILDQYTSILGADKSAVILDCRSMTHRLVPIHPDIRVVICDTRKKRELTGSEYPERRKQCELGAAYFSGQFPGVKTLRDVTLTQFEQCRDNLADVIRNRCQFIIEENQRVHDLERALQDGAYEEIGSLTGASYLGARDLYEIGSNEYQQMMGAMLSAPGVIGARQAGAGFGGCMVAFVEQNQIPGFVEQVKTSYFESTRIEPYVYPVRAVAGAGVISEFSISRKGSHPV